MKQIRYRYIFILAAFTLPFLSSCVKETIDELTGIKGIKVSNGFSAPLLDLTVGMEELYKSISDQADIKERSDKLLVFTYRDTIDNPTPSLITIPPIVFNSPPITGNAVAAAFFVNGGQFTFTQSDSANIPVSGGQRLKMINIKEGEFVITVNNTFKHNSVISLTFPTIKKNGVPLSQTINIIFGTTPSPLPPVRVDLAGYDLDLSNGGVSYNTLPFTFSISMTEIPGNTTSPTDEMSIGQVFSINSFNMITGYLGFFNILNQTFSQKIDLFDQQKSGQFLVNDPRLVIRVYNTFGVPLTGKISNLRVVGQDGLSVPVTFSSSTPLYDTFSFNKPVNPGEVAVSEYVIDKNNSNLDDAINASPSFVRFNLSFDANSNQVVQDNFLIDTSSFKADLDFEVPMDIKIVDYVSEQEQKQTPDTSDLPYVKSIQLAVRAENGLPLDIYTQLVYTNDTIINGKPTTYIVDSLFTQELPIKGANLKTDGSGNVESPRITVSNPFVSVERYKRIMAADNMITRSRIVTSSINGAPGFAKIYTTQKMNVKIGADIKLTYKSTDK